MLQKLEFSECLKDSPFFRLDFPFFLCPWIKCSCIKITNVIPFTQNGFSKAGNKLNYRFSWNSAQRIRFILCKITYKVNTCKFQKWVLYENIHRKLLQLFSHIGLIVIIITNKSICIKAESYRMSCWPGLFWNRRINIVLVIIDLWSVWLHCQMTAFDYLSRHNACHHNQTIELYQIVIK